MNQSAAVLRPRTSPTDLGRVIPGAGGIRVTGVSLDSRQVVSGDLYLALPGARTHGARFAAAAQANGARAVLTDPTGAPLCAGLTIPVVVLPDPRAVMGEVAAEVYGRPAEALVMFGLTGTNGKTSTMFLLEAALAAAGERVGTIGTIGFRLGGEQLPSARTTVTTPESPELQALLAAMREGGATSVAMEVSSHALAQDRVVGIQFAVSGFTNLGRDHLDYHHDMESYFTAKTKLFLGGRSLVSVVNVDDDAGGRLARRIRAEGRSRLLTCSIDGDADYWVRDWSVRPDGRSRVVLATPTGEHDFLVGMLGEFNVRNAMTAAAMAEAAGFPLERALTGFAQAAVPGRMQRVDLGPGAPKVVVDFAHTPEAVRAALGALPPGPRIVVLGCGGDRDPDKRGPMGEAAVRGADLVVVTDDNPRSERPEAIRAAVLAGARAAAAGTPTRVVDGGDRRSAIRAALAEADERTWIAVLGKGHERGQDVMGVISPFDDVSVVAEEWAAEQGKDDPDA